MAQGTTWQEVHGLIEQALQNLVAEARQALRENVASPANAGEGRRSGAAAAFAKDGPGSSRTTLTAPSEDLPGSSRTTLSLPEEHFLTSSQTAVQAQWSSGAQARPEEHTWMMRPQGRFITSDRHGDETLRGRAQAQEQAAPTAGFTFREPRTSGNQKPILLASCLETDQGAESEGCAEVATGGHSTSSPSLPSVCEDGKRVSIGGASDQDGKRVSIVGASDQVIEARKEQLRSCQTRETLFMPLPGSNRKSPFRAATVMLDDRCALMLALKAWVDHPAFDYFISVAILLNSVLMGLQVQFSALDAWAMTGEQTPEYLTTTSSVFCIIFVTELTLRIIVHGTNFLKREGWRWNVFDLVVVLLQVIEEVAGLLVLTGLREPGTVSSLPTSLTFMRVLRILRLVRIIRVVRVLHLIKELRTMVHSITNTVLSLFWTVLLLFLVIYTLAVCFTQVMADAVVDDPELAADLDGHRYFGSLERSTLSLYQVITGGANWGVVMIPLMDTVSPLMAIPFTLYISFSVLAMLNVITGMFVESAMANAGEENTLDLVHSLRQIVESMKDENTERLTWIKFKSQIDTPRMLRYFKSIELDPSEAESLFKLLDPEGSGSINPDDFVMGCLRLHGTAKAIDLTTLMCEVRTLGRKLRQHAKFVEAALLKKGSAPPAPRKVCLPRGVGMSQDAEALVAQQSNSTLQL